jgi:hypothetical protein
MSDAWTAELVRERLREAFAILRRSAAVAHGPSERTTYWPDAPNSVQEAYGYTEIDEEEAEAIARMAGRPSRDELSRMEEVLGWIAIWTTHAACAAAGLPKDAGWIALKRAEGWPWPRIQKHRRHTWGIPAGGLSRSGRHIHGGNSRDSLLKIEKQAYEYLARNLISVGVLARPAADDDVVRGLEPGPGAMPRVMDTVKPVPNEQPCGTCSLFLSRTRQGPRMLCTKYHVVVGPLYRAYAPPGKPCWVPKVAEENAA